MLATAALALSLPALLGATSAVETSHEWAPVDTAPIHPGVQTVTDGGGQCTANFVFSDDNDVFIGQAAHCAGTGEATDTNGCTADSQPIGTEVTIVGSDGNEYAGELAYSSWTTMQDVVHETDPDICAYNDFALVRLLEGKNRVNPSIPVVGGPTDIDTDGTVAGDQVSTYGNSSLRLGLTQLSPHVGTSLGTSGGGWTTTVYTLTPGLPGDSGSAVVSQDGEALGILVTLALAPLPGSNGVTDLDLALDYANANAAEVDLGNVTLERSDVPFTGNVTSLLGGLLG